jgi:hypothetical protein
MILVQELLLEPVLPRTMGADFLIRLAPWIPWQARGFDEP